MALVWNPFALAYMAVGLLSFAVSALVYFGRPWSERNRWLALALLADAYVFWVGVSILTDEVSVAFGAKQVWMCMLLAAAPFYLMFIGTFETPLARPLRRPWVRRGILATALAGPATVLLYPGVYTTGYASTWYGPLIPLPGPGVRVAFVLVGCVLLFGVVAAVSAYRRAPAGSERRRQMGLILSALAFRDVFSGTLGILYPLLRFSMDWLFIYGSVLLPLVSSSILGYAILRHQLLDIHVRARSLGRAAPEAERLALYRAALEGLAARDDPASAERVLGPLRGILRVTEDQHRALADLVAAEDLRHRVERRGRFRVLRELGRGGQGRALLARDLDLEREVVLKQPLARASTASRAQLLQEARAAARIRHPNVVAVLAILVDDDPPFLVLEHLPGGSVEDLLARRGPLPPAQAAAIVGDVLRGLERLHAEGLVHCDLKPGNVLLDADGTAKIGDFGTATRSAQSAPGITAGFASPEALRGDPVDARSDVWAAGALLRALLQGAPAARGTVDYGRREAGLAPSAPAAPALPPALAGIVARATAQDPSERFATAAAMAQALERACPRPPAAAAEPLGIGAPSPGRGGAHGAAL